MQHKHKHKHMLTGGTPVAAGGPRQSAETGIARAETLGPDGGQQIWKPGPSGAEGPTDAKESAHNLLPLDMLKPGKGAGARGGGPRGMGAEVGRSGAGARHAAQPAPGTAAGGRAIRGAASTTAQHGTLADNKDTRLVGGQDNGELSDVSQKYGTTPGTASALRVFNTSLNCHVRDTFAQTLTLCEPELSFRLVGNDDPKDGEI